MCPDWESNQQNFALQDDTQPTEPRQSGLPWFYDFLCCAQHFLAIGMLCHCDGNLEALVFVLSVLCRGHTMAAGQKGEAGQKPSTPD